jgi:hypothetical protein
MKMTTSLSDTIKQAKEDASTFVKMEKGSTAKFHIISKAKTFGNIFFENEPFPGAPKSINVPFGTQIPGYKIRPQWAFEVVNENGKHKILCANTTVVDAIDKADKAFRPKGKKDEEGAGYPLLDITLNKLAATPWWTTTAGPTDYEGNGNCILDMDAEIVMASAELIGKLSANRPKSQLKDGVQSAPSGAQIDLLNKLCKQKELNSAGFVGIMQRKFNKNELSECTMAEASTLIETLTAM